MDGKSKRRRKKFTEPSKCSNTYRAVVVVAVSRDFNIKNSSSLIKFFKRVPRAPASSWIYENVFQFNEKYRKKMFGEIEMSAILRRKPRQSSSMDLFSIFSFSLHLLLRFISLSKEEYEKKKKAEYFQEWRKSISSRTRIQIPSKSWKCLNLIVRIASELNLSKFPYQIIILSTLEYHH